MEAEFAHPEHFTTRDQREVTMVARTTSAGGTENLRRHTQGWRVGTGLPVSLPPGTYAVTDEQLDGDDWYLVLDDAFRIRKPTDRDD